MGDCFADKFYVDNYRNTYDRERDLIHEKTKLDELMLDANMPLQEWVSNKNNFNLAYRVNVPVTQNILGISWEPHTDTLKISPGDKLISITSGKFTK